MRSSHPASRPSAWSSIGRLGCRPPQRWHSQPPAGLGVVVCCDGRHEVAQQALQALGVELLIAPTLSASLTRSTPTRCAPFARGRGRATLGSALMAAGLVDRLITLSSAGSSWRRGFASAFASLPSQAAETAPRFRIVDRQTFGRRSDDHLRCFWRLIGRCSRGSSTMSGRSHT